VFTHGTVDYITRDRPEYAAHDDYFTGYYGFSPQTLGPDIVFFRVRPTFMVGFAQ
jgi:hypothetical protein